MSALLALLLTAAPDPALLEKLSAHLDRMQAVGKSSALTVTIRGSDLDADGKPTSTKEEVYRVTHADGVRTAVLQKATEDGADVTDKRKKDLESAEKKKPVAGSRSPFDRKRRGDYVYETLPGDDQHPGLVHLGFRPVGKPDEDLMQGEAWVEPEAGEAVRFHMRPSKLPSFVDTLAVEVRFDSQHDGSRMMSRITATGNGGFLFLRKRFSLVTDYAGYGAR